MIAKRRHDVREDDGSRDGAAILIIGADSLIGRSLHDMFRQRQINVFGTSRRRNSDNMFLDLCEPSDQWPSLPRLSSMIVCAAISQLDACQADPKLSYLTNVLGLEALVEKYTDSNTQIVFMSSSHVFSGKKPFPEEMDTPDPWNTLGCQKRMGEEIVLGRKGLVVRSTKIISSSFSRCRQWAADLRENKEIYAYDNLLVSLVHLDALTSVLDRAVQDDWRGIVHLSGPGELSYYEIARLIAISLGCNERLVVPIKGNVERTGKLHPHATLSISHRVLDTGVTLPSSKDLIATLIEGDKQQTPLSTPHRHD